jgi:hypothetical protein
MFYAYIEITFRICVNDFLLSYSFLYGDSILIMTIIVVVVIIIIIIVVVVVFVFVLQLDPSQFLGQCVPNFSHN